MSPKSGFMLIIETRDGLRRRVLHSEVGACGKRLCSIEEPSCISSPVTPGPDWDVCSPRWEARATHLNHTFHRGVECMIHSIMVSSA